MKRPCLFFAILLLLYACGPAEEGDKTAADFSPALEQLESRLPFPLLIPYDELSEKIDKGLKDPILEDTTYAGGALKGVKADIRKAGTVKLIPGEQRIKISLPLEIKLEQLIERKVLGINFKAEKGTECKLIVHLNTSLDIDSSYRIVSDFRLDSIQWVEDPVVKVAFLNIPVKKAIETKLQENQRRLEITLNKILLEKVNVVKHVEKVWSDLQKPIRINKKVQEVYLVAEPKHLVLNNIELAEEGILLHLALNAGLKSKIATGKPFVPFKIALPALEKRANTAASDSLQEDSLNMNLFVSIPVDKLNGILKSEVVGKSIVVKGSPFKITALSVEPEPDKLHIKLGISGLVSGELSIYGKMIFLPESKSIAIREFDYDLKSNETLLAGADFIMHEEFRSALASYLDLPIEQYIAPLPDIISKAVNEGKAGRSIDLSINSLELFPTAINYQPGEIQININAKGNILIKLHRL